MSQEFPPYLKSYIVSDKIELVALKKSGMGLIIPNGSIFVNQNDSLEEQVHTVLHEISHLHPEFISYTGGLWQGTIKRDESYEARIEAYAREIYRTRPEIVEMVKTALASARRD